MLPRETSYIILFLILSLTGLGFVGYDEIRRVTTDGFVETVRAILNGMQAVVVLSGALTYVVIEGLRMLAERYEKRRFQEGRAEGRSEGRSEGHADWEGWLKRKAEAEARGEDFSEPTPAERDRART
jgi:hypothetical protein